MKAMRLPRLKTSLSSPDSSSITPFRISLVPERRYCAGAYEEGGWARHSTRHVPFWEYPSSSK